MVLRDLFVDTLRTLWGQKLRTALTMFGIAWGIISITLMVATGEGLREGQRRRSEGFGKNILLVTAGRTSLQAGGTKAGRLIRYTDIDHLVVAEQSPDCQYVMPEMGRGGIPVRSRFNNGLPQVTGSLPPFAEVRTLPAGEGRFYNWEDEAEARRVVFLGTDVKNQLFGSRAAVGEAVHIGDFPYTVIGVLERKTQNSSYDGWDVSKVFIPFSAMMRDFPMRAPATPHSIDRLLVTPRSVAQHEACKGQVKRALGRLHQFDPNDKEAAGVWDTIENAKRVAMILDGMKYFLGGVGVVTLFLGGIGVMNVMLVAVRERTREIGVRKAVGASSRTILAQFFVETTIVVLLSGGLGLAAAFGLCGLVNLFPKGDFFAGMLVTWETALVSFGVLGLVALLAAMYPAARAASVDPIEALRYEAGG